MPKDKVEGWNGHDVEVGWRTSPLDPEVQVGVRTHHANGALLHGLYKDHHEMIGRKIAALNLQCPYPDSNDKLDEAEWFRNAGATVLHNIDRITHDPVDSLESKLDRKGVNRLIRSLRTARDRAFGKDE